jgi:pyruvate carboxylase subunit B
VQYEVEVGGRLRQVQVHRAGSRFVVSLDGRSWLVDAARIDHHTLSMLIDGPDKGSGFSQASDAPRSHEVTVAVDAASGQFTVGVDAVPVAAALNNRRRWNRRDDASAAGTGPQRITAPMPGKIVRVLVEPGDPVHPHKGLIVVEAMKMENELRASREGTVSEVLVHEGQSVDAGALLVVIRGA